MGNLIRSISNLFNQYFLAPVSGSALLFAMSISLMIALTLGVILISHTSTSQVVSQFIRQRDLIWHNQNFFKAIELNEIDSLESIPSNQLSVRKSITSFVEIKRHGIFDFIRRSCTDSIDTISKAGFIGSLLDPDRIPVFLLKKSDVPLVISGGSQIVGDCFLPGATYSTTNQFDNKPSRKNGVNGIVKESKGQSSFVEVNDPEIPSQTTITNLTKTEYYNSFYQEALVLNSKKLPLDLRLNGHIIIVSDTSLILDSTMKVKDVVFYSPTVIVKSGFKGSLQIIATDEVRIEQGVTLEYPSSILLNAKSSAYASIQIDSGSHINGIVCLMPEDTSQSNKYSIRLQSGASITGALVCEANAFIEGTITGMIQSSYVGYATSGGRYLNYLVGAELKEMNRDIDFSIPGLNFKGSEHRIARWLD